MRLAVTQLGIRAMQNRDKWKPSKFVYKSGHLAASSDPAEVGVGSRLVADTIAKFYDRNLKLHARGRLLDLGCGEDPVEKWKTHHECAIFLLAARSASRLL